MRKIVITGIGILSPLGLGKERFGEVLCGPKTSRLRGADGGIATRIGEGRIPDFDELAYMDAKTAKYCQRAEKLALTSARLAFADGGVAPGTLQTISLGVAIGSMTSNLRAAAVFDQLVLRGEAGSIDPSLVPSGIMNSLSGLVSIKNGIRGFHIPVAAGEASGAQAIQFALMQLETGRVEAALAGGLDELSDELHLIDCVKAISTGMKKVNQSPCEGAVALPVSEAAALLLLESADNAARRDADAYAECAGSGCAYSPRGGSGMTALRAALKALQQACPDTAGGPAKVDLIFASAGDGGVEMEALRQFFGRQLPKVVCLKSLFGDTLGASGALQVAAAAMTIKESAKPSAVSSDPASSHSVVTRDEGAGKDVKQALVSSFSADGHMSFLLLRRAGE